MQTGKTAFCKDCGKPIKPSFIICLTCYWAKYEPERLQKQEPTEVMPIEKEKVKPWEHDK